jgi:hypothetical protein
MSDEQSPVTLSKEMIAAIKKEGIAQIAKGFVAGVIAMELRRFR